MATASEATPAEGRWFYAQNRQKIGPLSWQALKDQAAAGILRPSDMVLRDGTGRWQRADSVEGLFAASVVAETVAEPPGPANGQSSSVSVTAAYLPAEPQTQSEGAQSAATCAARTSAAPLAAPRPSVETLKVPGYVLLGELGRGGMGVVYKAQQVGLNRLVALKMILAGGHAGPQELARFRLEAEAVARLQHPNIVQVYEVGQHNDLPYCVLEFVEGGSLAERLGGKPLPAGESAWLVGQMAAAMQLAHSRNIVHRDLKPANILLQRNRESGMHQPGDTAVTRQADIIRTDIPKITDFGLARQLDTDSGQTQSGAIMGTPSYMAPEQASGQTHAAGPAADIYALGAILYECLTGRPPFKGGSLIETLRQVREQDPVPPSRLMKVPRDLETICLKCLAKEPEKRYGSAGELAEDLRRWRDGEVIQARPVGTLERSVKWVRRQPMIAALLFLLLASGLTGFFAVIHQLGKKQEALALASDNADQARHNEQAAIAAGQESARAAERAQAALAKEEQARAREQVANLQQARTLYVAHMHLVQRHWERGDVSLAKGLLERHIPTTKDDPDFRAFEWFYYWRLCQKASSALKDLPAGVRALAFAPDGKSLAIGCLASLHVWALDPGKKPDRVPNFADEIFSLAYSPDGKTLAIGTGPLEKPGKILFWDVAGRQFRPPLEGHRHPVMTLAFTPDGKTLVSGSAGIKRGQDSQHTRGMDFSDARAIPGEVRLWDAATGKALGELDPTLERGVLRVAFSASGTWLVVGQTDGGARVYNFAERKITDTLRGHRFPIWAAAVSDLGLMAAAGGNWNQGELSIYHLAKGQDGARPQIPMALFGHQAAVLGSTFSHDGKTLITAGLDRTLRVWKVTEISSSEDALVFRGQEGGITSLVLSPDGKTVASGSDDQTVHLWDLSQPQEWQPLGDSRPGGRTQITYSPIGERLIVHSQEGITLWDTATLQKQSVSSKFMCLFDKSGRTCEVRETAMAGNRLHLDVVLADDPMTPPIARFSVEAQKGAAYPLAISPDLRWAAYQPQRDKPLAIIAAGSDKDLAQIPLVPVRFLRFSPDSHYLAIATWQSDLVVWDTVAGRQCAASQGGKHIYRPLFSPDSRGLATGSDDGIIRFWDPANLRELAAMPGHTDVVQGISFTPDGRTLASVSWDGCIKFWDVETREERLTLRGPSRQVGFIAFSSDGRTLASAFDGRAVLWRAAKNSEAPRFRGKR